MTPKGPKRKMRLPASSRASVGEEPFIQGVWIADNRITRRTRESTEHCAWYCDSGGPGIPTTPSYWKPFERLWLAVDPILGSPFCWLQIGTSHAAPRAFPGSLYRRWCHYAQRDQPQRSSGTTRALYNLLEQNTISCLMTNLNLFFSDDTAITSVSKKSRFLRGLFITSINNCMQHFFW